ncbi:MAG: PKD domain-containing protein [Deltaproteobacteria bacterium]|nr:PKD domain-containing protein [Deltaproteobacteria bacterium]
MLTSWEEYIPSGGAPIGTGGSTGPTNKNPVVDDIIIEQQQNYAVRLTVTAHDPDGTIISYAWQFSETLSVSTPRASVSHTFDGPGTYAVSLTVEDNNGAETSDIITVEVVESDDEPPPAPEESECVEDTDCDDGEFCNGAETCIDGECVEGNTPCAGNEVCVENDQACWTGETVAAKSLKDTFRRPRRLARKCIWLVLDMETTDIFNPANCRVSCSGPKGTEQGVTVNVRREIKQFAGFILVPICIDQDAPTGEWVISIQTESGTTRETIESDFTIK